MPRQACLPRRLPRRAKPARATMATDPADQTSGEPIRTDELHRGRTARKVSRPARARVNGRNAGWRANDAEVIGHARGKLSTSIARHSPACSMSEHGTIAGVKLHGSDDHLTNRIQMWVGGTRESAGQQGPLPRMRAGVRAESVWPRGGQSNAGSGSRRGGRQSACRMSAIVVTSSRLWCNTGTSRQGSPCRT